MSTPLASGAAAVLALWALFEASAGCGARWRASLSRRLLGWSLRPFAAWAGFNLAFRLHLPNLQVNELTYPLYAVPWLRDRDWREHLAWLFQDATVLRRLLAVSLLVAAFVAVSALLLRRERGIPAAAAIAAVPLVALIHLGITWLPRPLPAPGGGSYEPILDGWFRGASVVRGVALVESPRAFFRDFVAHQARLKERQLIHAMSHPPGGVVSLYWLGRAAGVRRGDVRSHGALLRYTVALTLASTLSFAIVFLLGRALFSSARVGWTAAALWAAAPLAPAYDTASQNGLYAVFFNLALLGIWKTCTAGGRAALAWGALLGAAFAALAFLCYSWILPGAVFGGFLAVSALRERWGLRDIVLRGAVPAATAALLAGGVVLATGLDYLAAYRNADAYVAGFYPIPDAAVGFAVFVGAQIQMLLMAGSPAASVFLATLGRRVRRELAAPRTALLGVVLAVYGALMLLGPSGLRIEVARIWNWVATVPFAFAASALLGLPRPRFAALGAVALGFATSAALRLFVVF